MFKTLYWLPTAQFLKAEAGSAPAATLQDPQAAAPGSNPAAPSQPTDPAPQPVCCHWAKGNDCGVASRAKYGKNKFRLAGQIVHDVNHVILIVTSISMEVESLDFYFCKRDFGRMGVYDKRVFGAWPQANPPAGGSSQSLLETLSAYGFAPNAGVSPSHQPTPEAAASIHPITAGTHRCFDWFVSSFVTQPHCIDEPTTMR
jgi:hypothetical protein